MASGYVAEGSGAAVNWPIADVDMLDDGAGLEPREHPSAEGRMLERGANSAEEVREPAAVYGIRQYRRMELFRA